MYIYSELKENMKKNMSYGMEVNIVETVAMLVIVYAGRRVSFTY
jgi:hypothetical protein